MSGKRAIGNDPYNPGRRRAPASSSNSYGKRNAGDRSAQCTPTSRSTDDRGRNPQGRQGQPPPRSGGGSGNPPSRRRPPRKRKRSRALRVLITILAVLVAICAIFYAFFQFELGKINRLGATSLSSQTFDEDTSAADSIKAVDWGKADIATSVDGVVNVLLVGQDTRTPGQRARADTMIVLSVNKNTNQLTMISLMRDLYVQIPGYSNNKLNSAYAVGGFQLLDSTISKNFGIVIDYNVEVNFSGFKDIVDTLGGIDIDLNQAEATYMNSAKFVSDMGMKLNHTFSAGTNHLNGQQALCYARIRHVGNSDWERTDRQRRVIQIIYQKVRQENWTKLLSIYSSVADDLTTDMNNTQIVSIASSAYSMGLNSINSYRIPADSMYTNETVNGMDILVPKDWNATRALLKEYLYSEDGGASAAKAATKSSSTTGTTTTTTTTTN